MTLSPTPQIWGPAELRAHYPGWSARRIRQELRRRVNLTLSRGQRLAVDLSDVQEIDRQLGEEALRRRQQGRPALRVVDGEGEPHWRRVLSRCKARG